MPMNVDPQTRERGLTASTAPKGAGRRTGRASGPSARFAGAVPSFPSQFRTNVDSVRTARQRLGGAESAKGEPVGEVRVVSKGLLEPLHLQVRRGKYLPVLGHRVFLSKSPYPDSPCLASSRYACTRIRGCIRRQCSRCRSEPRSCRAPSRDGDIPRTIVRPRRRRWGRRHPRSNRFRAFLPHFFQLARPKPDGTSRMSRQRRAVAVVTWWYEAAGPGPQHIGAPVPGRRIRRPV